MNYAKPLALALAVLASVFGPLGNRAVAQSITIPKIAENAFGNRAGDTSAMTNTFRAQAWYSAGHLPTGFQINQWSWRRSRIRGSAAFTADLVLRIENSSVPHSALVPTLDKNLGTNAQVVFNGPINVPATPAASAPDQPIHWFTLSTPFVFQGPNLIVDLMLTNIKKGGAIGVDLVDSCGGSLTSLASAPGCGTDIAASYSNGSLVVNNVSPIGTGAQVLLMAGVDNRTRLDLTPFGYSACELGFAPLAFVPSAADANGNFRYSVPASVPATFMTVSLQALHAAPSSPGGIALSDTLNVMLGNQGNYRMLLSADNVTAASGLTCDRSVALLLR